MTCCLQESVAGEWNGDVDLGDGKLQLLRLEYLRRLKSIPRVGDAVSAAHIQHLIHSVEQDLNKIYNCKIVLLIHCMNSILLLHYSA